MSQSNYRELFIIYLKGLAMGAADAVPGVSGGTIALITGIYERLVDSLTAIDLNWLNRFLSATRSLDISGIEDLLKEMDFYFLVSLGIGVGTSVVLMLNLVHLLLSRFPAPTYGFFFGLIAVSALVLFEQVDIHSVSAKISAVVGFSLAFLSSGIGATGLGHELAVIFLAGMLAVTAMVLPGISGSLILVILGQYEYITGALSSFTQGVLEFLRTGSFEPITNTISPIIVFVTGATIGLFSVVHIVERALESHRNATMAFLVSMVVGALRAPVLQVDNYLATNSLTWIDVIPEFTAAAFLGGVLIYILDKKTETI